MDSLNEFGLPGSLEPYDIYRDDQLTLEEENESASSSANQTIEN